MVKFTEAETFGPLLKVQRKAAGLSQATLAELTQTTTRNISNLETSKTAPTRSMVKRLTAALQHNIQASSELMRAAGFAYETYTEENMEEYQQQAQLSIDLLFNKHNPYPALALNRRYEITQVNDAFYKALNFLLDGTANLQANDLTKALPMSLFEMLFGLNDFNDTFVEQEKYARFLIQRVHREQLNNPNLGNLIQELQDKLPQIPQSWWVFDANYQPSPNLRTDMTIKGIRYETLGVVHSIGSPHDAGGNSVRVILSYPLNKPAKALFDSWR